MSRMACCSRWGHSHLVVATKAHTGHSDSPDEPEAASYTVDPWLEDPSLLVHHLLRVAAVTLNMAAVAAFSWRWTVAMRLGQVDAARLPRLARAWVSESATKAEPRRTTTSWLFHKLFSNATVQLFMQA